MSILITILAFIFALEFLVVIHEGGHFLVAKACGVKVLRFSAGFGPVIWKRTAEKSGTEFALSLLPLGGYVKMLDSREDASVIRTEEDRQGDFSGKKLWQKALIVAAGPAANLILAVLLFWGIGFWGTYDLSSRVAQPAAGTPAAEAGVRGGEVVIGIGDSTVTDYSDLQMKVLKAAGSVTTVSVREKEDEAAERARRHELDLTKINFKKDPSRTQPMAEAGLLPWQGPVKIAEVVKGSAAEAAGLKKDDILKSIAGKPLGGAADAVKILRASPGETLEIEAERSGGTVRFSLSVPSVKDEASGKAIGRIGVRLGGFPEVIRVKLGAADAFVRGMERLWDTASLSLRVLGRMVIGDASLKNLSGPVAIADYAGQAAQVGLIPFLQFIAMMSVSLGVLNLLPVPVLDGGHLALYTAELVTGKPPSEKTLGILQRIGLALILFVTIVALSNDIARLFGG